MEIIKLALEWIAAEWKKFLICLALTVASGVLVLLSVALYRGIYIGYDSCDVTLEEGVEKCAVIRLLSMEGPYQEFTEKAFSLKEVSAVGTVDDRGAGYLGVEELRKIQEGHEKNYQNALEGYLEVKLINPTLLPLCGMELQEGKTWDELDHSEEKVEYLYLGWAYRNIPVGTRYTQPDGSILEVAGIFTENFRFFDHANMDGAAAAVTIDYTEDCAYSVFCISEYPMGNEFFVSAAEGYGIEEAVSAVRNLADQMELPSAYLTLQEIFDEGYRLSGQLIRYMIGLIVICVVCSFTVLVSFRIISFWERSGKIGILLAVGFSRSSILGIYCIQDIINSALGFLGIFLISFIWIRGWFTWDETSVILHKLFAVYLIPAACLLLLAEIVVSGAVTGILLKRNSPADLLRK